MRLAVLQVGNEFHVVSTDEAGNVGLNARHYAKLEDTNAAKAALIDKALRAGGDQYAPGSDPKRPVAAAISE